MPGGPVTETFTADAAAGPAARQYHRTSQLKLKATQVVIGNSRLGTLDVSEHRTLPALGTTIGGTLHLTAAIDVPS